MPYAAGVNIAAHDLAAIVDSVEGGAAYAEWVIDLGEGASIVQETVRDRASLLEISHDLAAAIDPFDGSQGHRTTWEVYRRVDACRVHVAMRCAAAVREVSDDLAARIYCEGVAINDLRSEAAPAVVKTVWHKAAVEIRSYNIAAVIDSISVSAVYAERVVERGERAA